MKPTFFLLALTFLFISSCSVESIEEVDVELKSKSVFIENSDNGNSTNSEDAGNTYEVRNPVILTKTDND